MKTLLTAVVALIAMYVGSGPRVRHNLGLFRGRPRTQSRRDLIEGAIGAVVGMFATGELQRQIAGQWYPAVNSDGGVDEWALTLIAALGIMLVAYACAFALRRMFARHDAARQ